MNMFSFNPSFGPPVDSWLILLCGRKYEEFFGSWTCSTWIQQLKALKAEKAWNLAFWKGTSSMPFFCVSSPSVFVAVFVATWRLKKSVGIVVDVGGVLFQVEPHIHGTWFLSLMRKPKNALHQDKVTKQTNYYCLNILAEVPWLESLDLLLVDARFPVSLNRKSHFCRAGFPWPLKKCHNFCQVHFLQYHANNRVGKGWFV